MVLPCPECATLVTLTEEDGVQLANCDQCGRQFLFQKEEASDAETSGVPDDDERRDAQRVGFEAMIHLEFEGRAEAVRFLSENISEGGIFVRTEEPFPIGHPVDLEVTDINNKVLFQAKAEVAWFRKPREGSKWAPGMGLKFLEMAERHQLIVKSVCALQGLRTHAPGQLLAVEEALPEVEPPAESDIPRVAIGDFHKALYFIDQGLYLEALGLLEELAKRHPDNEPLVKWLEAIRERAAMLAK